MRRKLSLLLLIALISLARSSVADQPQPAAPFVMGYANRLSCEPGEEITFHLSASGPSVDLTIQRLGNESIEVFEKKDIACATHPIPDRASSHGCDWPSAFSMTIPEDWETGYYEAKMQLKDSDKHVQRLHQLGRAQFVFVP